jgi:hypothetical protein
MIYRTAFRLLYGVMAGVFLSAPLAGEIHSAVHFEESYNGAHPAEFAQLLEQVKVIVPGALAYITSQWNLPNQLHYPLIVIITERPPNLPAGAAAAYVRSVTTAGGDLRQTLIVDLGYHLLDPAENLDDLLYHEMAHAVLQDAVTGPNAAGIPQWFNEGLAQSITHEGHDRTAEDFKRFGHSDARAVYCDLNGHVDTFYHGEYNFGCYTYYYLAVEQLIQRGGKDTVVQLIMGLHNGRPLPNLIAELTRLDWPAFQQDAEQNARDVFAGIMPIP